MSKAADAYPHVPVLLDSFLRKVAPVEGAWVDATCGAGGFSAALIEAGADMVIGVDWDPDVAGFGRRREQELAGKFRFLSGCFGELDQLPQINAIEQLEGVVFDLGASSMQFNQAERGFSLRRDGPLDMRMTRTGRTAAEIVNDETQHRLAELFFVLGEERQARRIAQRIAVERKKAEIRSTRRLADIVESCVKPRQGSSVHPATRVFQALRIAVNNELDQLVRGLEAAERLLHHGGRLAVISFHSLEDRIVKRFMNGGRGGMTQGRHFPHQILHQPRFRPLTRRAIVPDEVERAVNPRSRSAKLRVALRTEAPPVKINPRNLGLPRIAAMGCA